MRLVIGHLYGELMNVYGDRGNLIALARRAQWRGIEVEVRTIPLAEELDWDQLDIVFIGGGQDRDQRLVCQDLQKIKGKALREAADAGVVILAICGGYQLLGHFFKTGQGEILPGISLFDAYTVAGPRRLIGNVVVECSFAEERRTLVGFENHSGRTYLGRSVKPLGKVLVGFGNNGQDHSEGAIWRNVYGSYLHGSLLPKNPWLADHLLLTALRRRYGAQVELEPTDDSLETQAHAAILKRLRVGAR